MSVSVTKVKLGSNEYRISRLPARTLLSLDKQVTTLLASSFSELKGTGINESDVFLLLKGVGGFAKVLGMLNEDELDVLLMKLFKCVQVIPGASKKQAPFEIEQMDDFDKAFEGENVLSIYKLAYEVMKHNQLSFFECRKLIEGFLGTDLKELFTGLQTNSTHTSNEPEEMMS